jgi:hypothetical protein
LNLEPHTLPATQPSLAELIDELSRFDGPPERFLLNMLRGQCHIAQASSAAIVRLRGEDGPQILALHPALPDDAPTPAWLAYALQMTGRVCAQAVTMVTPLRVPDELYEDAPRQYLIMVPLLGDAGVRGAEAFVIDSDDLNLVNEASQRLELSVSLLNLYEMRLTTVRSKRDVGRLGQVVEVLAAVNQHEHMTASAMAMCNEIAARFNADRVSIGFLQHRVVRLAAMSHTNRFSRKMKLVQAIESAMEESVDQDLEVIHPAGGDTTCISRAAGELAARYGPTAVLTFPLRHKGEPVAALTVERAWDKPFTTEEVESLRLICDIATARLLDLYKHDRWFGARMADATRDGLSLLVGAKHTWAKLAAAVLLAAALFLTFARGDYRVEATFNMEAAKMQKVPAPFDSFLASVDAQPGDSVEAGTTVLATLEVVQLQLQLNEAQSQYQAMHTQAESARREGDAVKSRVAMKEAERAQATVDLLQDRIDRATLIAPIDGVVLKGDLDKRLGGPVQMGEVLFEVAPLDQLWATLWIPEDRMADVEVGQLGQLASASHPGQYVPFIIEQIHPVAELVDQGNVFRVRARLLETHDWMRPGMEGLAKIDVGKERYAYIWSRSLLNWLRMQLWI